MLNTEKTYYSINEVQEITGLPATTLRYWESQFKQLSPRKDGHGNRYYTTEDIELIKQIKYLRDEMHITRIEAIRRELSAGKRQVDYRQRASEILNRVLTELKEIHSLL